jgi:membrane associated rhomboid family serine protease
MKTIFHPTNKTIRLLAVYEAFAVACELVYFIELVRPVVLLDLGLTRTNWWGIATSLLVHLSPTHIFDDAISIVVLSGLMYLLVNWKSDWSPPILALCILPFLAAITADAVYYVLSPNPMAAGSSGVSYGMMGVILAYSGNSVLRGLQERGAITIDKLRESPKETLRPIAMHLGVFLTLAGQVFTSPASFLNAEPGVNYGVHGLAFVIGMAFMLAYGVWERHSIVEVD